MPLRFKKLSKWVFWLIMEDLMTKIDEAIEKKYFSIKDIMTENQNKEKGKSILDVRKIKILLDSCEWFDWETW